MIKVNLGEISFEGRLPDIATEICLANTQFKKLCIKKMGQEEGLRFFESVLNVANMNEEEIKREKEEAKKRILKNLFRIGD